MLTARAFSAIAQHRLPNGRFVSLNKICSGLPASIRSPAAARFSPTQRRQSESPPSNRAAHSSRTPIFPPRSKKLSPWLRTQSAGSTSLPWQLRTAMFCHFFPSLAANQDMLEIPGTSSVSQPCFSNAAAAPEAAL